jgi:transposase
MVYTMKISIDVGKRRSYVVVENNGVVENEGYVDTTQEGFDSIMPQTDDNTFIMEAGNNLYPVADLLERRNGKIVVAHPAAMKMIAKAPNKTDKNDAHRLLDAYNADYLPTSYLPPKEIREDRNLCSAREFFVRQRSAVKNRMRYEAHKYGIEPGSLTKKSIDELEKSGHLSLMELVKLYREQTERISDFNETVKEKALQNHYATLIDTIPGIGPTSALSIASQIGDIQRFPTEFHFFSYLGLCPSTHQSGSVEWKGHLKTGNMTLRSILIECTWIHVAFCKDSVITEKYYGLSKRMGPKRAAVASAKRLSRIIYYMLIRDKPFNPYGAGR